MTVREIAFRIVLLLDYKMDRLEDRISHTVSGIKLSQKERKFLYNLVSGVVRHRSLLDWKASQLYTGSYQKMLAKFKIILRLALYEMDYLDFIPPRATTNEYVDLAKKLLPAKLSGVVNGMLRSYLREGKSLNPAKAFKYIETQLAVTYSFPEWMIKRWLHFFGREETEQFCRALNERPEFDIKIHSDKIAYQEFVTILAQHKVTFKPSSIFEQVIKVTDMQTIIELGLLPKGFCSVQDESGQLVVDLMQIKPGDVILDACAAPGSKYIAISQNVSKDVLSIALEIDPVRLQRITENCQRLRLSSRRLVNGDARQPPFKITFNKILVDAPCSGLGTIQKHPDIKWRRTLKEIATFQSIQLAILLAMEKCLKEQGMLIYSTCTVDPSENEEVIDIFLERSSYKYKVVPPPGHFRPMTTERNFIRTWPHHHGMEGSFAALLQRLS